MADRSDESVERISALIDGQLRDDELALTLAELECSTDGRADWDTFHVLGDIMRTGEVQAKAHDEKFLVRLRQRMAESATEIKPIPAVSIGQSTEVGSQSGSANDGSWRRVVGLASVLLAGILVWQQLPLRGPIETSQVVPPGPVQPAPQIASVRPESLGSAPGIEAVSARQNLGGLTNGSESPGIMIRDARLDAILAAHRQFGGISALPMPAGFVRSAVLDEGAR